jgi:acetyl-CoA C-acetyltransferase
MRLKHPVYIVTPVRTPIGKFGGVFSSLTAADLGVSAVKGVLQASELEPGSVDELIFGNARQAGVGPNVARQVLYRSGIPHTVSGHTINKACASGLQAIVNAAQSIQLQEASIVVAGGTESMSNTPYLLPAARWGYRMGNAKLVDGMYQDGFLCPLCGQLMGETAENLVRQYEISREEQDAYAVDSQRRNQRAREQGIFAGEIIPVNVTDSKKQVRCIEADETPRDNVTMTSLGKLPPVFGERGSVHAGNSSGITDGAAAMLVTDEQSWKSIGRYPAARILGYATAGVEPPVMGIGPVPAIKKLLEATELTLGDVDLVELNEAFAAQVLACARELKLDVEKLNVNGGAIAMGHPIGCSGARIVVTLMHELHRRKARLGIATLCVSGGMGMAMLLENLDA